MMYFEVEATVECSRCSKTCRAIVGTWTDRHPRVIQFLPGSAGWLAGRGSNGHGVVMCPEHHIEYPTTHLDLIIHGIDDTPDVIKLAMHARTAQPDQPSHVKLTLAELVKWIVTDRPYDDRTWVGRDISIADIRRAIRCYLLPALT